MRAREEILGDKALTPGRFLYASKDIRSTLSALEDGATWLDKISRDDPQYADLLSPISAQLWKLTGPVRECEHALAKIRAELREADAG